MNSHNDAVVRAHHTTWLTEHYIIKLYPPPLRNVGQNILKKHKFISEKGYLLLRILLNFPIARGYAHANLPQISNPLMLKYSGSLV